MVFDLSTTVHDYINVVVTNECNRVCKFCIDSYRGTEGFMEWTDFERAIKIGQEYKIRDMLIVGGEPTLHPDIKKMCQASRDAGFQVILTSNFDDLDVIYALDGIVHSFNFSYYGQKVLPDPTLLTRSDITLSSLIHKTGLLRSKEKLDEFINKYEKQYNLKFSTLTAFNDFTHKNQKVEYLDDLDATWTVLFNEIEAQIYRGHVIKRYDRVINQNADQSIKCHATGIINRTWSNEQTAPEFLSYINKNPQNYSKKIMPLNNMLHL